MLKNIVFDLGGVVVNYNPKKYLEKKFSNLQLEEYLYQLTFGSRSWRRMDLGVLDRETAEGAMLKKAREDGKLFEVQAVLDEWRYMMTPKNDTIALIKRLKQNGYKVFFLSNIPKDVYDDFCENYSFMSLFDGGVASFECNMLKPQVEIYKKLLDRYSLFAIETIFCDDVKENATAADELGIKGVHFQDAAQFKKLLSGYGVNTVKANTTQR